MIEKHKNLKKQAKEAFNMANIEEPVPGTSPDAVHYPDLRVVVIVVPIVAVVVVLVAIVVSSSSSSMLQ